MDPIRAKARAAVLQALEDLGGEAPRREIVERAKAAFTPDELALPSPHPKHASRVDNELAWTLTNLKREGRVDNPNSPVWMLVSHPSEPLAAPVLRTRLDELRAMPYRLYLRTPEWRETRRSALVRAGHACQLDRTHTERLEVHHNTYERRGEERPEDLVVLCAECHETFHGRFGVPATSKEPHVSVPPPLTAKVTPAAAPPRRSLLARVFG